jgi:hypothetical protein
VIGFTLFGHGAGDEYSSPVGEDEIAFHINLSTPIVFYGQAESQIYVSNTESGFWEPLVA